MAIKENYIEYVRDLLIRMIDHVQTADAPSTMFQHAIYDERSTQIINHLLEVLDDAIEVDPKA
ncbi:MAG: hypothetical protein EBU46_10875 [Nitrosomonadaceae bacterium]|nr:hypothetical protein [Nitrosomonadaceae bacterium]